MIVVLERGSQQIVVWIPGIYRVGRYVRLPDDPEPWQVVLDRTDDAA